MKDAKKIILKHALLNAREFGGKARAGSVIGKVIAERPELRKDMGRIGKEAAETVKRVNSWPQRKQEAELRKFGKIARPKKKEKAGLPELPNAKKGKVVMRLAPNPNGPTHIGHARMIIVNDEYVKKWKGKLILRFDDTDPKNPNKIPMKEAYAWFQEDLKWLGVKICRVERASSRISKYYSVFKGLLKDGLAYVCTCEQGEWSKMVRRERRGCPCRELPPKENLERWKMMLSGKLKEGEAVGRYRTDLGIPDPAMIDWVTFRIIDHPKHPFVKSKKVWPMLDFASAVDDHDFGITHIIRGKDLMISEKRQKLLYKDMGWTYPSTIVYGKFVTTPDMVISKSKIAAGIKKGLYSGYDDPRLSVLRAFRKRGIQPQAIRNYMIRLGLNEAETTVDLDILYSENRAIIDSTSNRYFFVAEPVEIRLDRLVEKVVRAPLYPGKRKYRKIPTSKKIYIDKTDYVANKGKEVRLMHFCNIKLGRNAKVTGKVLKSIPKIHWVPEKAVRAKLITAKARELNGLAEPDTRKVRADQTVQFERIGFARCDKKNVYYFAHR